MTPRRRRATTTINLVSPCLRQQVAKVSRVRHFGMQLRAPSSAPPATVSPLLQTSVRGTCRGKQHALRRHVAAGIRRGIGPLLLVRLVIRKPSEVRWELHARARRDLPRCGSSYKFAAAASDHNDARHCCLSKSLLLPHASSSTWPKGPRRGAGWKDLAATSVTLLFAQLGPTLPARHCFESFQTHRNG